MSTITEIVWATGWTAAKVREELGPDWRPTGRRPYPSMVVGFKSSSSHVSVFELDDRLLDGKEITARLDWSNPRPCSASAVHAAVNPVNQFRNGTRMYVVLMEAIRSHNSKYPSSHKWYGTSYRVVARVQSKWWWDQYRNYANDRVKALRELGIVL